MSGLSPVALVINPVATRAGRAERAEITRVLSPLGLEWSLTTTAQGDAARLARQAAAEGARVVVALTKVAAGSSGAAAEVGRLVAVATESGDALDMAGCVGWVNTMIEINGMPAINTPQKAFAGE